MVDVSIRRVKESEILQATRTIMRSINALRRHNNLPIRWTRVTEAEPLLIHLRKTDPERCYGAFKDGKMVGFAQAQIRENQWYLGFLFILPGKWGRGLGRKLLEKTMVIPNDECVDTYSLVTFSYNPSAVALYSKFGMMPIEPIVFYIWNHETSRKLRPGKPRSNLTITEIDNYDRLRFINNLDKRNRGLMRPEDHKFVIDSGTARLLEFSAGRKRVGYSVLTKRGLIGPISAVDPDYLEDITRISISELLTIDPQQVIIHCPGSNQRTIKLLLEIGMEMTEVELLLSNKRFGRLDCYIPAHLAVF